MKRLLLLFTALLFLASGCAKMKAETTDPIDNGRFVLEYSQKNNSGGKIFIFRDTETGEKYLFVRDGYAGGLTKLD